MTLLLSIISYAKGSKIVTQDNYISQTFKDVFVKMPDYREINSGSKIVVKYQGLWPVEMQSAFEHAVRIWEEVLPMTLPIYITATVGSTGNSATLSKVSYKTYDFNGDFICDYASPKSMIKSVLLQEYHSGQQHCFLDEIDDTSFLDEMDISITYNRNIVNQFDFSLDGEPDSDKYDFITVALRDIALGLGFSTSFTADTATKQLNISGARLTPYESLIMKALGSTDPTVAYLNATRGKVDIPILNGAGEFIESVYAPKNWRNGVSLRYLIPGDSPISKLLSYDFGKGYVMRDLSGVNWNDYFAGALAWMPYITTSTSSGFVSETGYSEDILPYKGEISLSFNERDNFKLDPQNSTSSSNDSVSKIKLTRLVQESDIPTNSYCKKYDCFSPNGPIDFIEYVSLSVLKNDGSWDCIYMIPAFLLPPTINIEDLSLNFEESEYARGTTGGLRYRLTKCVQNNQGKYEYRVKYFTRDFTPQIPKILYLKGLYELQENVSTISTKGVSENRFVDVKVGIGNVEGTTRVIVEQLDEGEDLPFQYDADDFRKGYFIANLDRECSTKLTVVSYNKNGFSRSNTITIPALGYSKSQITFNREGDSVNVDGLPFGVSTTDNIHFSIVNLSNPSSIVNSGVIDSNKVYIGNLDKGMYVLTLVNESGQIGTYKFYK